jgi:hypothetical protein
LEKSYSFKSKNSNIFNKKLYTEIFKNILSELNSLSIKYANIGYYEDAYNILSMLYLYTSSPIPLENYCMVKVKESKTISIYAKKMELLKNAVFFAEDIAKKYFGGKYVTEAILIEIILITESHSQKNKVESNKVVVISLIYRYVSTHKKGSTVLMEMLEKLKTIIVSLLFAKEKELEKEKNIDEALQV